jgi:uracil-DNA glycosylase
MTTKAPPSRKSDKSSKQPTSEKKPKLNIKKLSVQPEPLKNAGEEREACQACALFRRCGEDARFHLPRVPEGWSGKLLIVSTGSEDGAARKFMRSMWRKAGYEDSDIAQVPALRCSPKSRNPSMVQIRACRPFLLKAIRVLKPERIIGLGSTALRALRNQGEENITRARGKKIEIPGL